MTQAKTRDSTPRRTASKIKAKTHVGALEGQITDVFLMAEVAALVAHGTLSDREPRISADQASAVTFAVYQLAAAVRQLRSQYFEILEKAVA